MLSGRLSRAEPAAAERPRSQCPEPFPKRHPASFRGCGEGGKPTSLPTCQRKTSPAAAFSEWEARLAFPAGRSLEAARGRLARQRGGCLSRHSGGASWRGHLGALPCLGTLPGGRIRCEQIARESGFLGWELNALRRGKHLEIGIKNRGAKCGQGAAHPPLHRSAHRGGRSEPWQGAEEAALRGRADLFVLFGVWREAGNLEVSARFVACHL